MNYQTVQRSCLKSGTIAFLAWCGLSLLFILPYFIFKVSASEMNVDGYLALILFALIGFCTFILGYWGKKHYLQERKAYQSKFPELEQPVFRRLFHNMYRTRQLKALSLCFLGGMMLVGVTLTVRHAGKQDIILLILLAAGWGISYLFYLREKDKPSL